MEVRALTFDTYGTVVDWRRSVLAELERFGAARGLAVDWAAFLADWKARYRPGMDRVNRGEWPWITVDEIYRRALEELPTMPQEWRRATTTSDWGLRLTPERALELLEAVRAVVDGWTEDPEDTESAESYVVQLHTFVRPGTLDTTQTVGPSPLVEPVETEDQA